MVEIFCFMASSRFTLIDAAGDDLLSGQFRLAVEHPAERIVIGFPEEHECNQLQTARRVRDRVVTNRRQHGLRALIHGKSGYSRRQRRKSNTRQLLLFREAQAVKRGVANDRSTGK